MEAWTTTWLADGPSVGPRWAGRCQARSEVSAVLGLSFWTFLGFERALAEALESRKLFTRWRTVAGSENNTDIATKDVTAETLLIAIKA